MVLFLLLVEMIARVGINGFGRIGRVIFRTCMRSKDLQVTAINDPAIDIGYICYLIKFDSTHGRFKSAVTFSDGEISIDDKKIKVFCEKLPSNIPWQRADVQYVVEASGMFTNLEKASGHLASPNVKRVIVTAPTVDIPMLILGVNKEQINPEHKVISCASSTLYCLAPIVKILEDNYGVEEGFITSIHAMTPSLKPLDGLCLKGKHWRDHRSIHQNIIPAATGACKALGKIIPSVKDKLTGLAFRVPIVNVSVLDISVRLNKNTTIQDIIKCVETESKLTMKNIIKISKDQEVSSDFLGDENSCILDVNSSLQLNPKFFKLICWYENEYSYACRVVGSIKYSQENHCKVRFDNIISSKQSILRELLPNFKTEHVISNCHTLKNPKLLLSTSQETVLQAKSSERQKTIEKPSPLQSLGSNQLTLREIKQSNEIFKVWNDEVKISRPLVKDNENTLFQSCMTVGGTNASHLQSNYCLKTKERLEEVKKEFSKMVDMTESLLKKSSQSSREIIMLKEEIENEEGKKDTKHEFNNTPLTLPTISKSIPTSRCFQTNINKIYKDVFKTYKKENFYILMDEHTNELNDTPKLEAEDLNQQIEIKCNAKIPDKLLTHRQSDNQDYERNNEKFYSAEVYDDVVNQRNFRIENTICNHKKFLRTITVCNNTIQPNFNAHKPDLGSINLCEKLGKHDIQHDEGKKIESPKNNLNIDHEVNSTKKYFKKPDNNLNYSELKITYINPESCQPETNLTNKNETRKKIIEGILKILTADSLGNKTRSPSLMNTNTTVSTREVNKSLNIYDKIDSASATDSENSFQINEKTSQVIDITDLTSSTEDLARLDKICRIIEISDEMSDRLFSALDNNDDNTKQKQWSFKDLCERLKLDDFCNNVFGPS